MTLESFWYQHADAAGAALIVAVLAAAALLAVIRRYERLARAQRRVYRLQRWADRQEFRRRLNAVRDAQGGGLDDHAARALRVIRTPLMEAYVCPTVDEPSPYAPVWTSGGAS